jgi:hypothetical protein
MQKPPTPACKAAHASKAAQARIAGLTHDNALLAVKLTQRVEHVESTRIQSICFGAPLCSYIDQGGSLLVQHCIQIPSKGLSAQLASTRSPGWTPGSVLIRSITSRR